MDEIKDVVKGNKAVKAENVAALARVVNESYATKVALLNQKIVDNNILKNMVKLAGDTMMDLQDEIDEKDCVITEYKKVIGDEVVNKNILNIAKVKYNLNYDVDRSATKNKLLQRMSARLEKCIE